MVGTVLRVSKEEILFYKNHWITIYLLSFGCYIILLKYCSKLLLWSA